MHVDVIEYTVYHTLEDIRELSGKYAATEESITCTGYYRSLPYSKTMSY